VLRWKNMAAGFIQTDEQLALGSGSEPLETTQVGRVMEMYWPSQDIRLLRGCCARINHLFTPPANLHCPPWCNTIARLLDSIRLHFRPPVCIRYSIQD